MSPIRPLPVPVRLYPGEAATSYWSRLCTANAISERDLWLALRHADRGLPTGVSPRAALAYVEALGGLRDGALVRDSGGQACSHGGATRQVECPSCRMIPDAVTLCRRCAAGDRITVARMHGPVCIRHRRWRNSEGYAPTARHLAAQRRLNGSLARRGVSYGSSEVEAAAELLQLRATRDIDIEVHPDPEVQLFPERIELTALLTDDRLANVLMPPGCGGHALATLFDRLVEAHEAGLRASERMLDGLRIQGRELWMGGSAIPLQGGCALTPFAQRVLPRAATIRAHALRHRVELAGG